MAMHHPRAWLSVPDDGEQLLPVDREAARGCLLGLLALAIAAAIVWAVWQVTL